MTSNDEDELDLIRAESFWQNNCHGVVWQFERTRTPGELNLVLLRIPRSAYAYSIHAVCMQTLVLVVIVCVRSPFQVFDANTGVVGRPW